MHNKLLSDLIDNGTTYANASHVFQSDYQGNIGKDRCLEMFGEQNKECIEYNKTHG